MIGLNNELRKLEEEGKSIIMSQIGAGQMGKGMVSQVIRMKGMVPAVVVDINVDNAKDAYISAGVAENKLLYTKDCKEANDWILKGNYVYSDNSDVATKTECIQAVVEATGVPEVGAQIALDTIFAKKHIIMLNAETDAVVSPLLKMFADNAGVVYTGASGDEPAAVMELYDFADAAGFDIRVIGKGKNNKVDFECNPDTVKEEADRRGASAHMITAFKEGSKTMVEMALMCNATGLIPDVRGAHGVKGDLDGALKQLATKEDGGVLNQYGVVDYVDGIAPGVFVIVSSDQPAVQHEMEYVSMGPGPNYMLYRPYHLCSLETPLSVALAVLRNQASIAPKAGLVAEVITVAKKDMKAGEFLDGIGGYTVYGTIETYKTAKEINALPVGLVNRKTQLTKDVKKGDVITYDMVTLDESSLLLQLRKLQEKIFG